MSKKFEDCSNEQKLMVVSLDFSRHVEFSLMAGVASMGKRIFKDSIPLAATDGLNDYFNPAWFSKLTRKQARFVCAHEWAHKMLMHCVLYKESVKKYPQLSNMAMDYVVNAMLKKMDPSGDFLTWEGLPDGVEILYDPKHADKSYPEVLRDLLKNPPPKGKGGGGKGGGGNGFDEHIQQEDGGELDPAEYESIGQRVNDAIVQGEILRDKLRQQKGLGTGGAVSVERIEQRMTRWQDALRQFILSVMRGRDTPRYSRLNTRIYSVTGGRVILPGMVTEKVGPLIIAADTSGSMAHIYPTLFGEVAAIARSVKPEKIVLIWWDSDVAKVQTFTGNYDALDKALCPAGGGGTSPECVVEYIKAEKLKAQCVIWLTDGYIGEEPLGLHIPQIWGVIDNDNFNAHTGKTMHINSALM